MKIKLNFGYTDKDQVNHKEVEFGYRPKVSNLIALDSNPQARNPTQYQQLIRRLMITKFGSLKTPVAIPVLLKLDTFDDDLLSKTADEFLVMSRNEKAPEILPNNEVKLMFGIEIESVNYDIIKFGNRLIVADNVEADALGNGVARLCFQIGRQVSEIRNSETGLKLEGQLSFEKFSEMDSEDFNAVRLAAEFFRVGVSQENAARTNDDGVSDSEGNRLE